MLLNGMGSLLITCRKISLHISCSQSPEIHFAMFIACLFDLADNHVFWADYHQPGPVPQQWSGRALSRARSMCSFVESYFPIAIFFVIQIRSVQEAIHVSQMATKFQFEMRSFQWTCFVIVSTFKCYCVRGFGFIFLLLLHGCKTSSFIFIPEQANNQ